ncbi:Ribosomal RNA-processing protein 8 [Aphelenchoides bicaudatus]|nr:Ribosomal RNA-processing protein 8 [Aphelenchoides bicaudatus]
MSDGEVAQKSEGVRKAKRPWRHKVRREATKKRKQAEREAKGLSAQASNPPSKKKKNKSKQKGPKAQSDKSSGQKDETNDQLADPAERLIASRFRYLNEQLYTQPAKEAEEIFKDNEESFTAYHSGYRKQLEKWPLNPLDFMIRDLNSMEDGTVVADMGCGEARIAAEFRKRFKVHSFDLVAANKHVTACNITKTPLPDASVDVAVYCLSLMGTNLGDFFREANRILKDGGKLKIAEVTSRFRNVKTFIFAVEQMGFELKKKKDLTDFFIVFTFTKVGKVKQKRPTGLILEPCLYKKR